MSKLEIPEYMDAPWLTNEYVGKNGWYPVCDESLKQYSKDNRFVTTIFGDLPWKSRKNFKPGSIIIFSEYEEGKDNEGKYETDRFLTIDREDIKEYKRGERDLLPVGIVVNPPKKFKIPKLPSFFNFLNPSPKLATLSN